MANGHGIATLHFDEAPEAAKFLTYNEVADYPPNPTISGWGAGTCIAASHRVCYAGGSFFAVSRVSQNFCQKSDDGGKTWVSISLPITVTCANICYGNGTLVISTGGALSAIVLVSTNKGASWTQVTAPTSGVWDCLAFGNGTFVMLNANGPSSAALSSTDNGATWQSRVVPSSYWNSVAHNGTTFVAVGGSVSSRDITAISSDGLTWSQGQLPVVSSWGNIVYGNGYFFAATGGTIAAKSSDGLLWEPITLPTSLSALIFGAGVFVGLRSASAAIYASSDLLLWSLTAANLSVTYAGGAFGPEGFVGVGNSSSLTGYSIDGFNYKVAHYREITPKTVQLTKYKPNVGSNIASITITGQTALQATDSIEAWIQGTDSTADHNAYEHKIKPFKPKIANVVAGVGFDIIGISELRLDGDFKVRWAWAT